MVLKIIDVSRYQGRVNWRQVKASGIQGAMLRVVSTNSTFGGVYTDPFFEENYAACKSLGIPVGAYYYTYAQDKTQADVELLQVKTALQGKRFELPIAVDVEDSTLTALSVQALTTLVDYALSTVESWGAYAMLYTYTNFKNTRLDMAQLAKYDVWQADYRGTQPQGAGMWQYTSSGNVQGVNGRVDLNYAYRNYPVIIKNAALNDFATRPQPSQTQKNNPLLQVVKRIFQFLKGE